MLCYRQEFHGEIRAWLEDVLATARALNVNGLESLPFNLSDAQKSHDWVVPVFGKPRPGDGGTERSKDGFLRAILQPLELVARETGARHYPYVMPADGAARLAEAFARARQTQPHAPLVPDLQVVLSHLLQQARDRSPVRESRGLVTVQVPAGEALETEIHDALAQHVERALDAAFPQGRDTVPGKSGRTRALIALRQLADEQGRRSDGLFETDLVRMIGPDGREVLDRLSAADTRIVITREGRCALSHDQLAKVVTEIVVNETSRGRLLLDQPLIDLSVKIGQKLALYQSDAADESALSFGRWQRQLIQRNRDTLLFDEPRRTWWAAAERARQRRTKARLGWGVGAALAAIVTAVLVERSYSGAVLQTEIQAIGDPPNLERLLETTSTPDVLLAVVERHQKEWVNSNETFGAMSFALEDVWLRTTNREIKRRAMALAEKLRDAFIELHARTIPNFQPPPPPTEDRLNEWKKLESGEFVMGANDLTDEERPPHSVRVSAFSIQQHEVTNEEYQRFDPKHPFLLVDKKHPVVNVSWFEAAAYAAWLGASLPTEAQWEYAARGTGPTKGRPYPWGTPQPLPQEQAVYDHVGTMEVGSRPAGRTPEGLDDMAGNAWEWCRDIFARYQSEGADSLDPLGPATVQDSGRRRRVVRGGGFDVSEDVKLRADRRDADYATFQGATDGFRLVSSRLHH